MTIGRIPSVEGGIQPTIVDAKGDLIAGVAADSVNRLAVGSNDQVLVADSSTSTGLAWKSYAAQFVAGKNKIINGDFGIWQRGTSFSYTGGGATTYTADRFAFYVNGNGTFTISQQAFTAGTAPVSGYEGRFFCRFAVNTLGTSTDSILFDQRIEDVRTFAGQTITVSFWAKADSTRTISPQIAQNFGSGGSSTVVTTLGSTSLSTSWTRYTFTTTLASVSGKTIGTSSYLNFYISAAPASSMTIDIWGVQVEAGSVATPFTTATGTIQGELAACQRYYWRTSTTQNYPFIALGGAASTTAFNGWCIFPVPMRIVPTVIEYSTLQLVTYAGVAFTISAITLGGSVGSTTSIELNVTSSGMTAGTAYVLRGNNSSSAYLALSAEL